MNCRKAVSGGKFDYEAYMKKIMMIFLALMPAVSTYAQDAGTLVLNQEKCREMALASSEDMQKSANSLTQAGLDRKIAVSGFLPSVDGTGLGIYMTDVDMGSGTELLMRGTYLAGITLTQPLYAGGKIIAGHRMSKIGEEASREQQRRTRAETIYDADNAYWTYVSVLEKLRVMESLMEQMDTLLSSVGGSVSAGMATDNDLLNVEAKRSEVQYQMQKVCSGVKLCRMALCRVIGVPYSTEIEVESLMPESIGEKESSGAGRQGEDDVYDGISYGLSGGGNSVLPAVSIDSRPEMKLLQCQVDVAEQQIKMTRGDYLPTLALSGGYSYFGNMKMHSMVDAGDGNYVPYESSMNQGFGTAMLTLSVPIFKWGQGCNKVRKAKLDLSNAKLDMQKNADLMSLECEQAAANLTDSYALIETAEASVRHSDENLRVTGNRYEASMCPLSDLLDAQSQWVQARSSLIEAVTQYHIAYTDWLRASGTLVPEE